MGARAEAEGSGEEAEADKGAPDGGWGWMVLVGAMAANFVVIGHSKSFGVYFESLMAEFDASPSSVAWLQSIQIAVFSFLSPVSSVLSQRFGSRRVALCGGCTAFLGLVISAFAPTLPLLYVCYGFMQGVALTFTFTPGITMIAKYFRRRRGLANGMTMAGNAMGGMVMPLVANRLIGEYTLRGCLLIMAGVLLHACAGAMLWQPVEWHMPPTTEVEEEKQALKGKPSLESGLDLTPTHKRYASGPELRCNGNGLLPSHKRYASGPELHYSNGLSSASSPPLDEYKHRHYASSPKEYSRCGNGLYRRGSAVSSSPQLVGPEPGLRRHGSSFMYLSAYSFGPNPNVILTEKEEHEEEEKPKQLSFLKKMAAHRSIFSRSRFYLMTVSMFFHVLGYPCTQMFLPLRATRLGLSQAQAASLLSVLSLSDLVGRVCCSWASDHCRWPRQYWFSGGMGASALFVLALPLCDAYASLLAATAGFGLCCGAYIGLVVALFADTYAAEQVALAYSVSMAAAGFMALLGPPLMGYILAWTDSYLVCQIILGCAQFAGASIWLAEPWGIRWEQRRRHARSSSPS